MAMAIEFIAGRQILDSRALGITRTATSKGRPHARRPSRFARASRYTADQRRFRHRHDVLDVFHGTQAVATVRSRRDIA